MISLKDKTVIITGASSGIGEAAAIEFAKKGTKVVMAARRIEKLDKIKEYIADIGGDCIAVQTDVANENSVKSLFDKAEEAYGQVDIVINNAGRGLKSKVCDIDYNEWAATMDANVTGVFLCTKEAINRMKAKNTRGHIITVCSIAGLFSTPGYAGYCASKHAVTSFQRALWLEMLGSKIKISTIYPGRIDTEFFDIYEKRPHRKQMLSPQDIAVYLAAIASRSLIKKYFYKTLNVFKRIYYFVRYSVGK